MLRGQLFVKPIDMLLKDDTLSYANGESVPMPYVTGELLESIQRRMDDVLFDRSATGAVDRLEVLLATYTINRKFTETIRAEVLRWEASRNWFRRSFRDDLYMS